MAKQYRIYSRSRNTPTVSIIITTYMRDLNILSLSIESVLKQTYTDFELIIVDDSPEDYVNRMSVCEYCKELIRSDDRITYIQHLRNLGACAARNTGLTFSKGEYVCFLDDDDRYTTDHVSSLLAVFYSHPDIALAYSNVEIRNTVKPKLKKTFFDSSVQYRGFVLKKILENNFIGPTSAVMIRAEVLKNVGGFDIRMPAFQDWELWIRICRLYKIDFTNSVLLKYYIYPGERITNNTSKRLRALTVLNSLNKDDIQNDVDIYVARKYYEMRLNAINHDFNSTLRSYTAIIKKRPKAVLSNILMAKSFARIFIKNLNA